MKEARTIQFELSKETVAVLRTAGTNTQGDRSVISRIAFLTFCCGSNDSPPTCCY
jgi:hypothetical protein